MAASPSLPSIPPDRQKDQLRRFLYPSLSSHDRLPFLLPLPKDQQDDASWVQFDYHCQLLVAQILRLAISPWYSKLSNDREFHEEVTNTIRIALQSLSDTVQQFTPNGYTRIERLVLDDIPAVLMLHYDEYRRAMTFSDDFDNEESQGTSASPAAIYLASNPHPALSMDEAGRFHVDQTYLDVILLSMFQSLLPEDHCSSHSEVLILIDVVKGLVLTQLRLHGSGTWAVVRFMLHILDTLDQTFGKGKRAKAINVSAHGSKWYDRANLLLGLKFIFAVLKTLFLYLVVVYLDIFTPTAEPKKRSRRRKGHGSEMQRSTSSLGYWNLLPLLALVVEALRWRDRMLTRFVDEWVRIGLLWGGNALIERQAKQFLTLQVEPNRLLLLVDKVRDILHQELPPPMPPQEPDASVQRQEYDLLIAKVLKLAQAYTPIALLLGHDDNAQRDTIQSAISPFLEPLPTSTSHASLTQVADIRTLLVLLERCALLVNPALEQ